MPVTLGAAPGPDPAGNPHRREWLLASLFIVAGATAVLAGVSGVVRAPERALRVGANFWIGYEPLRFLADGRGPGGPRIVELRSTSAVLEGLRSGTLDGAALTIDEAIRHSGPDLPLAIVLVLDRSEGADAVVARPGRTAPPTPGVSVGVETEGVGALVLSRFLTSSGLTEADVRVTDIPASVHADAFRTSAVDYLVTYEPHVTALEQTGATRVFDSLQMPGEVVDVLVVRQEVLTARHTAVGALVAGWFRGIERMRLELARGSDAIAGRLDLPRTDVATILRGLSFPDPEENRRILADGTVDRTASTLSTWARGRGIADAGRWLNVVAVPPAR